MDPAIAYEMRVRFRQDMAKAFGDEWHAERLPKIEMPAWLPRRLHRDAARERRERIITMRRNGYSLERIQMVAGIPEARVWAILCRWAPELLPEKSEAAA